MAPALTSNSFLRNPGLRPRPEFRVHHRLSTVTYARQSLFGGGKTKDGSEEDESAQQQPADGWKKFQSFFVDIELPNANSLIPVVNAPSSSLLASRRRKEPQTVFVAGATGQVGIRIAQKLLRQGFTVRAGVPDLSSAQELARIGTTYKVISPAEAKRLNAVKSDYSEPEAIAKAIGPASKVVVTIGPGENGATAAVSTDEALQVVRAAELAAATHVVVVYDSSSGVADGSSTGNVIDGITTFFSNISSMFAQSQSLTIAEFLDKLVESDVRYTVIKTSLKEDYLPQSEQGLVVSSEGNGSLAGSTETKVAKSQIAALVADVFSNASVAENKVVEVSTSPTATAKPVIEALSAIPEDGRRKAYEESVAKAKAEEAAVLASQRASEAENAASKSSPAPGTTKKQQTEDGPDVAAVLENGLKEFTGKFSWDKLSSQLATAVAKNSKEEEEEEEEVEEKPKAQIGKFSWDKLSSQLAAAVAQKSGDDDDEEEEKPKSQIATIRGLAKARKLPPQKAVVKQAPKAQQRVKPKQPEKKQEKKPETKPEVKKVFGIFKQETIYIDDD